MEYGYDQSASVVQQQPGVPPATVTSVTINSQPTMFVTQRDWDQHLCGCCNDMEICCCVWWCGTFYACIKMTDFGESCCDGWPCCLHTSLVALRYHMRKQENIQGTLSNDSTVVCCCTPCAMCQLFNQQQVISRRVVTMQPMGPTISTTTVG